MTAIRWMRSPSRDVGLSPRLANAWASSGDSVQNNPLSSGATALTVSDADAPESTGYGQRFAADS